MMSLDSGHGLDLISEVTHTHTHNRDKQVCCDTFDNLFFYRERPASPHHIAFHVLHEEVQCVCGCITVCVCKSVGGLALCLMLVCWQWHMAV